ncbi:MAG: 4'-phosphopantetheinyl transferase superfamily protein [Oligoflexus sp.]
MIGNDIVDMADVDCHPRFARRVLCEAEWARYQAMLEPEKQQRFLWQTWAAKEASFKALRRIRPDCQAIARHFECDENFSRVSHAAGRFFLSFPYGHKQGDYIFAVSTLDVGLQTEHELALQTEGWREESRLAHILALDMMEKRTGSRDWQVVKDTVSLAPMLVATVDQRRVPCSITHHGRFYAVSLAF